MDNIKRLIIMERKTIPDEIAKKLCQEIRLKNKGKYWKWQYWICWGCNIAAGGNFEKAADFTKRCAGSSGDSRGCSQVNKVFDAT